MVLPASTVDLGSADSANRSRPGEDNLALMIAWAPEEPGRVGEIALFVPGEGTKILGRGDAASGSGGERVGFYRQRPGELTPTGPLQSAGVSREQLRLRLERGGLRVERIGKCAMELAGERVDGGLLAPGQTLLLKKQVLLHCTQRPLALPPLGSTSVAVAPAFGAPDVHGIVGESPATWLLRDLLAWTAAADEHTILLGASGSGKELAARAIHALSSRSQGPFVARNAATIPESLIDAELFGNVRGYPNPGMPERPGLIGAANGGTLFLDEIGELPPSLQANLLRVLDEGGEYHNLGGSAVKRSNFRLIGATNRSPEALKHDLAARLVLRLWVPGLGERRDDIPLLCRHLLRRAAAKSPAAVRRFLGGPGGGESDPRVRAGLVDYLLRHEYRTNVRELDALLWRAMSESPGDAIQGPPASRVSGAADSAATASVDLPSVDSGRVESGAVESGARESGAVESGARESGAVESGARESGARESGAVESGALAPLPVKAPPSAPVPEPSEEEIRASLEANQGSMARTTQALRLSSRYVLYRLMRKYGIRVDAERGGAA